MAHIVIDGTKCKSCYLCIEACPKKIIKVSNIVGKTGSNIVEFFDDAHLCIGCGFCAMTCPDLAITEVHK